MGPGLAEVQFKGTRKDYFRYEKLKLNPGFHVIVEADRGEDLGEVRSLGSIAEGKCDPDGCGSCVPEQTVLRRAREEEVSRLDALRSDEERVRTQARAIVKQHRLKMKVTEAEWQFDRKKLIIYFTADRRVDFRTLVRDLARCFRTRIELRQIGVRDEAALLGGVGRCHRGLCSRTWIKEIQPVSLQLAKDQNLSLSPAQISGVCGRLMNCLRFEHRSYLQARRRFPKEGKILSTARGREKVLSYDAFRETVTVRDPDGNTRTVPLKELRGEVVAASMRRLEPSSS